MLVQISSTWSTWSNQRCSNEESGASGRAAVRGVIDFKWTKEWFVNTSPGSLTKAPATLCWQDSGLFDQCKQDQGLAMYVGGEEPISGGKSIQLFHGRELSACHFWVMDVRLECLLSIKKLCHSGHLAWNHAVSSPCRAASRLSWEEGILTVPTVGSTNLDFYLIWIPFKSYQPPLPSHFNLQKALFWARLGPVWGNTSGTAIDKDCKLINIEVHAVRYSMNTVFEINILYTYLNFSFAFSNSWLLSSIWSQWCGGICWVCLSYPWRLVIAWPSRRIFALLPLN